MFRRLLAAFAVLFLATADLPAQVVIDNFNEGSFNLNANSVTPSVTQTDTGLSGTNTLGSIRIARAHFVSGGGTGDSVNVNNTALPGKFSTNLTVAPTTGHFHLYYGYSAYNSASSDPLSNTHTFSDINANIAGSLPAGNIGVTLNFDSIDHNGTFVLKLVSDRTGTPSLSIVNKFVPANVSPFVLTFTNAEILGGLVSGPGINFSDIDQVILESQDLPGATDMTFDQFEFVSVPEPTTYLLVIGTALAAGGSVWYRRRRAAIQTDLLMAAEEAE